MQLIALEVTANGSEIHNSFRDNSAPVSRAAELSCNLVSFSFLFAIVSGLPGRSVQ
jgi:hypothetical protein